MFEFLIAMMTKNTLQARTRELIILHLAWLGKSLYEFSHHAEISRELNICESSGVYKIELRPGCALDELELALLRILPVESARITVM